MRKPRKTKHPLMKVRAVLGQGVYTDATGWSMIFAREPELHPFQRELLRNTNVVISRGTILSGVRYGTVMTQLDFYNENRQIDRRAVESGTYGHCESYLQAVPATEEDSIKMWEESMDGSMIARINDRECVGYDAELFRISKKVSLPPVIYDISPTPGNRPASYICGISRAMQDALAAEYDAKEPK